MKMRGGFAARYFLARATRIYPLYLVAILLYVAISFALQSVGRPFDEPFSLGNVFKHIFMLQGITGVIRPLGPAWSLTYEAFYYLIWPLLLIAAAYRPNRAVALGVFGCVSGSLAIGALWKTAFHGATDSPLVPISLILFGFITWGGGAWLATNWKAVERHIGPRMALTAVAGVIGSYVLQSCLAAGNARQWASLVLGVASLPFWLAMLSGTRFWEIPRRLAGFARLAGLLSYPLYLLHRLFIETFDRMVPVSKTGFLSQPGGYFLVSFAATLLACIAIGIPLETAILRWRRGVLRDSSS